VPADSSGIEKIKKNDISMHQSRAAIGKRYNKSKAGRSDQREKRTHSTAHNIEKEETKHNG
jgi:hypothetical protein